MPERSPWFASLRAKAARFANPRVPNYHPLASDVLTLLDIAEAADRAASYWPTPPLEPMQELRAALARARYSQKEPT